MNDWFMEKITRADKIETGTTAMEVRTVSFTGHRPHWDSKKDKLGTGYSITNERASAYGELMRKEIVKLMRRGAKRFISGGALGVDQIAYWTVHKLQREGCDIENILAVPFESQYSNWRSKELVAWYHAMVKRADEVVYVDTLPEYSTGARAGVYVPAKMQKRNEYMVNNSDVVIAVWNGTAGGTGNCVNYAMRQNKEIVRINPIKF
jgi:uncharacterized phage-like protein YoqJ